MDRNHLPFTREGILFNQPNTISCFAAYCIPLLIQQNVDGSDFFNRSWAEFKVGFNNTRGKFYWIGNERLSQLTVNGPYKLRFDLQVRDNSTWYWTEYSTFLVHGESRNYQLSVSGYSGNAGDALGVHDGMMFSTYDRDNDQWPPASCAVRNGGGFWYEVCGRCTVNTVRGHAQEFRWNSPQRNLLLRACRMWLTCQITALDSLQLCSLETTADRNCSATVETTCCPFNSADDDFFHRIKINSSHVLQPYLPDIINLTYQLRTCSHNITLINKTKLLNSSDFIVRTLRLLWRF